MNLPNQPIIPDPSQLKARPYPLPPLPPNRFYVEAPDPARRPDECLIFEECSDIWDSYVYRIDKFLTKTKTAFQNVIIADTFNYGRILALDGAIQSAHDDEDMYHEMLVQPAMLRHHEPRDVLIIGGGEGATLREVLVHRSVRHVTMVDIDRELVELCREHLLSWHRGAFDDRRVRMVFDDGRKFVENDDRLYDVVIIDIVDMLDNGPAQALYTRQFYEHLRKRLRPDALVVVQGLEFSFSDDKQHTALARTLRTVFPEVHSYHTQVPSFLSTWGYLIASDWFRPQDLRPADIDAVIANRLGQAWLSHVEGDFLAASFCLSKETRFLLGQPGPILEDGVPLVLPPDIEDIEPPYAQFPINPL
jgi:spermidine synthase